MLRVVPVRATEPAVVALLDALTAELALGEYTAEQTFGYTAEQLAEQPVQLLGVFAGDQLAGVGGVELQDDDYAELKRCYVVPAHRGTGAADALLDALIEHARGCGVHALRLETGDKQHAALRWYRRHGFVDVPRFGPYVDSATSVCLQRDLG